ncbi:MAG: 30S ribosomal protein S17e [Candidatus Micrarchaeota archaeon]|nr:30S ribosomal protein S17e [Candidatus Micrarchaeota archaeon]
MGRIKSTPIKKLGDELLAADRKFTLDFTKNKGTIREMREIKSKKTLNLVAGYITNEVKKQKNTEDRNRKRAEAKKRFAEKGSR